MLELLIGPWCSLVTLVVLPNFACPEEHEIYLPGYIYLHLPMEVIGSCFFNWMICRACFIRHGNTCTCNLIILCLNY